MGVIDAAARAEGDAASPFDSMIFVAVELLSSAAEIAGD